MEKLYIPSSGLIFNEVEINLLIQPVIEIGLGIKRKDYIVQCDSNYGEFLIFQDGLPKFIFSAFDNKGEENKIASLARQLNVQLDDFLIKLLVTNGYKNVHYLKKTLFFYELEKQARINSFRLLEIVDLSDKC